MSCVWESRDIYKLGEWGIIDGKKLYIWKIETVTKGNELYHTYYMKPRAGLQTPVTYNASLAGVSLLGRVTATGTAASPWKTEICSNCSTAS